MILGLAGPRIIGRADEQAVAFLVDVSDSVTPPMRERQLAFLREATAGDDRPRPRDDHRLRRPTRWSNGRSARPARSARSPRSWTAARPTSRGRSGWRWRRCRARWRARSWSSRTATRTPARRSSRRASRARPACRSRWCRWRSRSGPEVLVRQVETPAFVREGEKFSATLTIEASQDTQARVHLLADGRLLASQDVNLTQGSNSIVMPQEPLPPGFHLFRVQVEASADTFIQNNEGGSYTVVTGQAARPDRRVRRAARPSSWRTRCARPGWRSTSGTPRRPSSTCRRCAATRAWCWRTCRPPT